MDRTTWVAIVVCFGLLMGWQFYVGYKYPYKPAPARVADANASPATNSPVPPLLSREAPSFAPTSSRRATAAAPVSENEETAVLENDQIIATFTTRGGSVKSVELKKNLDEGNRLIHLNRDAEEGIFNLTGWSDRLPELPFAMRKSDDAVSFTYSSPQGFTITRQYKLGPYYQVFMQETVTNTGASPLQLPKYSLNVGTSGPIHLHDNPTYTGAAYLKADNSYHKITGSEFGAGSIFGLFTYRPARTSIDSAVGPLKWAAVYNQFFAVILTANEANPIQSMSAHPVVLPSWTQKTSIVQHGIQSEAWFPMLALDKGASVSRAYSIYAGPKEYDLLGHLSLAQDKIMDYGIWTVIIRPLLAMMRFIDGFVGNWGISIILLTLLIKGALWPFQTAANKSMKQMQALNPKITELREKLKDDPQKMNAEMLKLYKEYGVNPAGGCLPVLLQMPILISFYVMLQSAVELRGASFLWIHDLTQPDTVAHLPIFGLDVNPLPLIMTGTSILQMRMTPQAGDNTQVKMMQFMPLFLLFLFYNFAAALALYWTVSNMIAMLQTYINLRRPVPVLKRLPKKKKE